jgi:hypothetical protein
LSHFSQWNSSSQNSWKLDATWDGSDSKLHAPYTPKFVINFSTTITDKKQSRRKEKFGTFKIFTSNEEK